MTTQNYRPLDNALSPLLEALPLEPGERQQKHRVMGPALEHRARGYGLRLLVPCDLSNLDAALKRLPQDKKRMGFRLNVNYQPWMLRPNGNFGQARVSRTEGKRVGWETGHFFVHESGICTSYISLYARPGSTDLPPSAQIAMGLAGFCLELNEDPKGIRSYGLDSNTHCMCCGRELTVTKSQMRGVGPDCVDWLSRFFGTDLSVAELEAD